MFWAHTSCNVFLCTTIEVTHFPVTLEVEMQSALHTSNLHNFYTVRHIHTLPYCSGLQYGCGGTLTFCAYTCFNGYLCTTIDDTHFALIVEDSM